MWENIPKEPDPDLCDASCSSYRLKVPGGWIVRTIVYSLSSGGGCAVDQTFISDADHTWELKKQS